MQGRDQFAAALTTIARSRCRPFRHALCMSAVPTFSNSRSVAVYKHLLIATDGSELAGKAVAVGLELAKSLNARTTAVNVTEPWSATVTGDPVLMYPAI